MCSCRHCKSWPGLQALAWCTGAEAASQRLCLLSGRCTQVVGRQECSQVLLLFVRSRQKLVPFSASGEWQAVLLKTPEKRQHQVWLPIPFLCWQLQWRSQSQLFNLAAIVAGAQRHLTPLFGNHFWLQSIAWIIKFNFGLFLNKQNLSVRFACICVFTVCSNMHLYKDETFIYGRNSWLSCWSCLFY